MKHLRVDLEVLRGLPMQRRPALSVSRTTLEVTSANMGKVSSCGALCGIWCYLRPEQDFGASAEAALPSVWATDRFIWILSRMTGGATLR